MNQKTLFQRIESSVFGGDAAGAGRLADEALRGGADPLFILEKGFTKALRMVGDRWEEGEMFLPEMILAAEAVKEALRVLRPRLADSAVREGIAGATCVLGSVRGDIHDIGKNIVGTMLEAFGFRIIDLGTDVDASRFVSAVGETGAGLLGMSALLTSTMPEMGTVVRALEEAGLRRRVRIAIGGAPTTPRFAEEIGADGHADDGGAALRLFQGLAQEPPIPSAARLSRSEARHAD